MRLLSKNIAFFFIAFLLAGFIFAGDKLVEGNWYSIKGDNNTWVSFDKETKSFILKPAAFKSLFKAIKTEDNKFVFELAPGEYLSTSHDGTVTIRENPWDWEKFTVEEAANQRYYLRSHHGNYLRINYHTNQLDLSTILGEWEAIEFIKEAFPISASDKLDSGNWYSIKGDNNTWVSFDKEAKSFILKPAAFKSLFKAIKEDNQFIFELAASDKYLSASNDGTVTIRDNPWDWEKFTIEDAPKQRYYLRSSHGNYLRINYNYNQLDLSPYLGEWEAIAFIKEAPPTHPYPWIEPIGIANPQNACYTNATMQMLLTSRSFVLGILNKNVEDVPNLEREEFNAVKNFLLVRQSADATPKNLMNAAKPMIEGLGFSCHEQSDASEIGIRLIDLARVPSLKTKQMISLYKNGKSVREIIKYEELTMLQLEIPDQPGIEPEKMAQISLQDILNNFSNKEMNAESEQQVWIDEKQTGKSDVFSKQVFISELNDEIFLHLKRFKHTAKRLENGEWDFEYSKLYAPVTLPESEIIDYNDIITPELRDQNVETLYRIKSIVVHKGEANAGHYIAYVRYGDNWYLCDDSLCMQTTYHNMRNDPDVLKGSYMISLDRLY